MTLPRIFAVVPAAGLSRRMGQPKLLLPVGGRTVIARVLDALRCGGVAATYVLLRCDDLELQQEIRSRGVCTELVERPTEDMRASVQRLLQRIAEEQSPRTEDAWLLAPADHPVLNPLIVARLIEEWRAHPTGVVVPTCGRRRGHPTLFGWPLAEQVARLPAGQGLNRLLQDVPEQVRAIAVESPEILQDLDTPADYARLKLIVGND
jgi:molybdenum cofactor cytidylyltransferase